MRTSYPHLQLVHSAWNMPRIDDVSAPKASLSESGAVWRSSVGRRLGELVSLPTGWDGYVGLPVDFLTAHFAMSMLESICVDSTEPPQIVPGTSGDLQVEWHTLEGDVELHVLAPNKVHGWYSKVGDGEEEINLTNDFRQVARWVMNITESPIALAIAAA